MVVLQDTAPGRPRRLLRAAGCSGRRQSGCRPPALWDQLLLLGRQVGCRRSSGTVHRSRVGEEAGIPSGAAVRAGVSIPPKAAAIPGIGKPVERAVQLRPLAAGKAVQQCPAGALGGIDRQGAVGNAPGLAPGRRSVPPKNRADCKKPSATNSSGGAVHAAPPPGRRGRTRTGGWRPTFSTDRPGSE